MISHSHICLSAVHKFLSYYFPFSNMLTSFRWQQSITASFFLFSFLTKVHFLSLTVAKSNICITFCSVKYSDVDENGIVHMMLCRVIMGNVEIVHPGSKQHRPSSDYFDSGVDDLKNPQHYIVWDMNLNRHIYSEFVVTIKMPSITKGN